MAELKTRPNELSVEEFILAQDERTQRDCATLIALMKRASGEEPRMWGSSMVGFGSYHYRYASGHEGDAFLTGFSPRKANLVMYIMSGFSRYEELMEQLGKHKTGKSCLYVKKLDDINLDVLEDLVASSVEHVRTTWPSS